MKAFLIAFCLLISTGSPTLYYLPSCPYSQKVLQYLKNSKQSVTLKNVNGNASAKNELEEKGGELRVPCLIVDDGAIYGADNIISWLKSHQGD